MDVKKMSEYPAASMETFLDNCDFGRELLAGKTSEAQEFRRFCRDFLDQLVTVILNSHSVSSVVAKGLCSFSPEILLEGDAHSVFTLFADLTGVLVSCGILSSDDSNAAIAQFSSYVVEKRRWHEGSDVNASEIPDVVRYLLQDFSFVARPEVCRVLKLCCLVVGVPAVQYPPVSFDLSGCALSKAVFHDCVRLVQSYVLCAGYEHQVFFTDVTLEMPSLLQGFIILLPAMISGGITVILVWTHSSPTIANCILHFCWHAANLQRGIMWSAIKRTDVLVAVSGLLDQRPAVM